jgi:hypothetical protein
MKKIINQKVYNTETATGIVTYSYLDPRDFGYIEETLYQTKYGQFFIHGEGGSASEYRERSSSNSYCNGSDLFLVDEKEALDLAEKRSVDVEKMLTVFWDVLEEG